MFSYYQPQKVVWNDTHESWTFQSHTHILGVTAMRTADADLAPRKAHPIAEGHITHIR